MQRGISWETSSQNNCNEPWSEHGNLEDLWWNPIKLLTVRTRILNKKKLKRKRSNKYTLGLNTGAQYIYIYILNSQLISTNIISPNQICQTGNLLSNLSSKRVALIFSVVDFISSGQSYFECILGLYARHWNICQTPTNYPWVCHWGIAQILWPSKWTCYILQSVWNLYVVKVEPISRSVPNFRTAVTISSSWASDRTNTNQWIHFVGPQSNTPLGFA